MSELGVTVEDAMREFGFTHPNMVWRTYGAKSTRAVQIDEAIRWAKLLRAPLDEVIRRLGYVLERPRVRVVGAIRGDARVSLYPEDRQSLIDPPSTWTPETRALVVDAPFSALSIWDGGILYFDVQEKPSLAAVGRLALIGLGDHPAPIVGILDKAAERPTARGRRVFIFGGTETIETTQVISATPITWQRFA